jgi:hypothetical protein
MSSSSSNNNNIEKMIEKAMRGTKTSKKSPLKRKNSINDIQRMLMQSPVQSPNKKSSNINWNFFEKTGFMSPPREEPVKPKRKIAPGVRVVIPKRKIAPGVRPKRKIAPPALIASPDRKFAHKFDGMNSGEKDARGRIIYIGKSGGKYVISSVGSRVPVADKKLKEKANKGNLDFTGKYDRNGLKIYNAVCL